MRRLATSTLAPPGVSTVIFCKKIKTETWLSVLKLSENAEEEIKVCCCYQHDELVRSRCCELCRSSPSAHQEAKQENQSVEAENTESCEYAIDCFCFVVKQNLSYIRRSSRNLTHLQKQPITRKPNRQLRRHNNRVSLKKHQF